MEGDHQHGGNEDGSGDGDIDVALGEGQDQHESDGDFNPILFQEATFASGDKNKAVRYLKFLETIWFLIRILMHTETNINFISKVTTVSKVRETIYILGLGVPGLRPPTQGKEQPPVLKVLSPDHLSHDIL